MDIWEKQAKISNQLERWAAFSIGSGAWLSGHDDPALRAIGAQFAGWGAIDGVIARVGRRSAQRRQAQPDAADPAVLASETRQLRRLLLVNAALDVGYILTGAALARREDEARIAWSGHGAGVAIQGAFLLLFDLWHALTLPAVESADA